MNVLARVSLSTLFFLSVTLNSFSQRANWKGDATATIHTVPNFFNSSASTPTEFRVSNFPRPQSCRGDDFTYSRDVCAPLSLTVLSSSIGQLAVKWDFGDGNIVAGAVNPTHTYGSFGNYDVTLYLEYPGCADTITKTISVDVIQDKDLLINDDTLICVGSGMRLRSIPGLAFCWSPTLYLDDPESSSPLCSPPIDMTYYYRADVKGQNLVPNGDFSQGNSGFTSDYSYTPASGVFEGNYNVGNDIKAWQPSFNNCGDHTSGSGNMMMVNGSNLPVTVLWSVTVPVTINTNYELRGWLQNLTSPSPANLSFYINGEAVGKTLTAGSDVCLWKEFKGNWSSAGATTAVIEIINETIIPEGNDFAIDDLSFTEFSIKQDSVRIFVQKPLIKATEDSLVCAWSGVQLNTTGGQSYVWSPATGLSDPSIANPVATIDANTQFIVTGTTSIGCSAKDTVLLTVRLKPAITITRDTVICKNGSVHLSMSGGTAYSWSPAATLNDPNVANPVASPVDNTIYHVSFQDAYTCTFTDSVAVSIRPTPVFAIMNSGQVCSKDSLQLLATGGDIYSWQPSTGLSNPSVASPMASPGSTTQYAVTILESACGESATLNTIVNVLPSPTILAGKSNDLDCSVGFANLTATGGVSYSWNPAATLDNPLAANPMARPKATTEYVVAGTDGTGCVGYDTIQVKVEGTGQSLFLMPNAFTPNNDGVNDCFGIKYWGVVTELELAVFNRWGERIFFSKDPMACWDGTYKGKRQENGVYIYYIKAKTYCTDAVVRKGSFTLVR